MADICVYGSSSNAIDGVYLQEAYTLGSSLARTGYGLVFGAGDAGIMGAAARGAKSAGGKVTGVLPSFMNQPGIAFAECDELILTNTMRERKQIMEDRAHGFIALPGGIGTFEELLEILTLKQLGQHQKAIVLLDTNNYYGALNEMIERCVFSRFAKPSTLELYQTAGSVQDALSFLQEYEYHEPGEKWFK